MPDSTTLPLETIDDVIRTLDAIVEKSKRDKSRRGYFAAIYRRVTRAIKEGIDSGFYENPERMERLDVIFARRYLESYDAYDKNEPASLAWVHAFDAAGRWWPVVVQHLLIGINVHISLDLGIAAAEVVRGDDLESLSRDFFKINGVLKSMIDDVEKDLAKIWWFLRVFDFIAGRLDEYLAHFGMEYARDHAWRIAARMSATPADEWNDAITEIDAEILKIGQIIHKPSLPARIVLILVRLTEYRRVRRIIEILE